MDPYLEQISDAAKRLQKRASAISSIDPKLARLAIDTYSTTDLAALWLVTPSRAFGDRTPIETWNDHGGAAHVMGEVLKIRESAPVKLAPKGSPLFAR